MPLPQPANYTFANVQDPTETLRKNVEIATNIASAQQQAQVAALAQQKMARQMQAQQDFAAYAQNPTAEGATRLAAQYPELSEQIERTHKMQTEDEQKVRVSNYTNMFSALNKNAPDVAGKIASDWGAALKNSGRDSDAKELQYFADQIKSDPTGAKASLGFKLASIDPNFPKNFAALTDQPFETAKKKSDSERAASDASFADRLNQQTLDTGSAAAAASRASVDNLRNEITNRDKTQELAQQKAAQDKLKSDAEISEINQRMNTLPPDLAKTVVEYRNAAQQKQTLADNQSALADMIRQNAANLGKGVSGQAEAFLRKMTGNQNAYDDMKNQFDAYKAQELLRDLKEGGGRQSPAGIELEKTQFPDRNANPALLETALRRMSARNAYDAAVNRFNGGWASSNRSEGNATKDFSFGGISVKKGDDPESVINRYVPRPAPVQFAGAKTGPPPAIATREMSGSSTEDLQRRLAHLASLKGGS